MDTLGYGDHHFAVKNSCAHLIAVDMIVLVVVFHATVALVIVHVSVFTMPLDLATTSMSSNMALTSPLLNGPEKGFLFISCLNCICNSVLVSLFVSQQYHNDVSRCVELRAQQVPLPRFVVCDKIVVNKKLQFAQRRRLTY